MKYLCESDEDTIEMRVTRKEAESTQSWFALYFISHASQITSNNFVLYRFLFLNSTQLLYLLSIKVSPYPGVYNRICNFAFNCSRTHTEYPAAAINHDARCSYAFLSQIFAMPRITSWLINYIEFKQWRILRAGAKCLASTLIFLHFCYMSRPKGLLWVFKISFFAQFPAARKPQQHRACKSRIILININAFGQKHRLAVSKQNPFGRKKYCGEIYMMPQNSTHGHLRKYGYFCFANRKNFLSPCWISIN